MFVKSYTDFKNILKQHESETNQKYIVYYSRKAFTQELILSPNMTIHWENNIPYFHLGTRTYICHHGKDINIRKKENYAKQREKKVLEDNVFVKQYKRSQVIKKLNCPATIVVKRVFRMPEYKVLELLTKHRKVITSEFIKDKILDGDNLIGEEGYLFNLPSEQDHKNHTMNQTTGFVEPDEKVRSFITGLVNEGKNNISVMTELLEVYVQQQLLVTDKCQQRFYPNRKTMRILLKQAKKQLIKDKIDQENLNEIISSWMSLECNIFFRSCSENIEDQKSGEEMDHASTSLNSNLLFVYQNDDMQNIYRRYGHNCILLDAAYRTSKYALPLYFVVVQTNVNFQIVGVIVTQFKTTDAITEALLQFKTWNSDVIPKYAMVDFTAEEIHSLENVFPDTQVYICSFHREQAWNRWVSQRTKRQIPKGDFLVRMRNIANATSLTDMQNAVETLKSLDYYSVTPLKQYFENVWEKEIMRWVLAYEPTDMFFNTNTGVERLNEELKYKQLEEHKNFRLSEMLQLLIENFIPEMYQVYMKKNLIMFEHSHKNDENLPSYLYKRPEWFINHILITSSQIPYKHLDNIFELENGLFQVPSEKENTFYTVRYDKQHRQCYCTCRDFCLSKLICKHILLVGKRYPYWDLENQLWILDNPIFKVDDTLFEITDSETKNNSNNNPEFYEIFEVDASALNGVVENSVNELINHEKSTDTESKEKTLINECNAALRSIQSVMCYVSGDNLLKLRNTLNVTLSSLQICVTDFTSPSILNNEIKINGISGKRKNECDNFVKTNKLKM